MSMVCEGCHTEVNSMIDTLCYECYVKSKDREELLLEMFGMIRKLTVKVMMLEEISEGRGLAIKSLSQEIEELRRAQSLLPKVPTMPIPRTEWVDCRSNFTIPIPNPVIVPPNC